MAKTKTKDPTIVRVGFIQALRESSITRGLAKTMTIVIAMPVLIGVVVFMLLTYSQTRGTIVAESKDNLVAFYDLVGIGVVLSREFATRSAVQRNTLELPNPVLGTPAGSNYLVSRPFYSSEIESSTKANPYINGATWINLNGGFASYPEAATVDLQSMNVTNQEWFQTTMTFNNSPHQVVITEPYTSDVDNSFIFTLFYKVFSGSGENRTLRGYFGYDIIANELMKGMANMKPKVLGDRSTVLLIDPSHRILADMSGTNSVGQTVAEYGIDPKTMPDFEMLQNKFHEQYGYLSGRPENAEKYRAALQEVMWTGDLYVGNDKKSAYLFVEPLSGFIFALLIDRMDVVAYTFYLLRYVLIIGILMVLIAIFAGLRQAQSFGVPLNEILKQSQAMAKGELPVARNVKATGEMRVLFDAFSVMADSIREKTHAADLIGNGKLQTNVPVASENDVLGLAMRRMQSNLNSLLESASYIAEGQFSSIDEEGLARQQGDLEQVFHTMLESLTSKLNYIQKMASGDFRESFYTDQTNDELGQALTQMSTNLIQLIGEVNKALTTTVDTSKNLGLLGDNLDHGTAEQLIAIQDITKASHSISEEMKTTSVTGKQAHAISTQTMEIATDGNRQMQSLKEAVEAINESSNKIYDIIQEIEDIASQTGMLAMNASIEAAHAGDAGRGFAIVANEVRSLSVRSKESVGKTTESIKETIDSIQHITHLVEDVTQQFNQITSSAQETSSIVRETNEAIQRNSAEMEKITSAIYEISEIAQGTSDIAKSAAHSVRELNAQSDTLATLLQSFKFQSTSETEAN